MKELGFDPTADLENKLKTVTVMAAYTRARAHARAHDTTRTRGYAKTRFFTHATSAFRHTSSVHVVCAHAVFQYPEAVISESLSPRSSGGFGSG